MSVAQLDAERRRFSAQAEVHRSPTSLGDGSCVVVCSAAAPDHVDDGADAHADADNPADPLVELREGQRGAENVEQGLDPQRVDKGAVLHEVSLFDQDGEEEQAEEGVVALNNDGVGAEVAVGDGKDREKDCEHAESNR